MLLFDWFQSQRARGHFGTYYTLRTYVCIYLLTSSISAGFSKSTIFFRNQNLQITKNPTPARTATTTMIDVNNTTGDMDNRWRPADISSVSEGSVGGTVGGGIHKLRITELHIFVLQQQSCCLASLSPHSVKLQRIIPSPRSLWWQPIEKTG